MCKAFSIGLVLLTLAVNSIAGMSPLMDAADRGDSAKVSSLLKKGANPNRNPRDGSTPLILAANNGHLAVVRILLENGADVNGSHSMGGTALIVAAASGRVEVVKLLLQYKADPHAELRSHFSYGGRTAIVVAAQEGHSDIVSLLKGFHTKREMDYVESLLKESEKNRTLIIGTLLSIAKSEDTIRVRSMNSLYAFPIKAHTKILDENGKPISISEFKLESQITVALGKGGVMEIIRDGATVTFTPY